MPSNNFTTKADTESPYRVDDRVTVGLQRKPVSVDSYDGPTQTAVSGVRFYHSESGS